MYMADNTDISIRHVRSLNYTFYPLRDLPHFASCGSQIPFTWRNAYWGLWVEPTRSWKVISSFHPCQAFSYGHLG